MHVRAAALLAGAAAALGLMLPMTSRAAAPITPAGEELAAALAAMDVEHHWLAHQHVHWRTGEYRGDSPRSSTHCSAFVAATCARLGVPILSPPEHSAKLLANAQADWLAGANGARENWTRLPGASEAQDAANRGTLVVAVYKKPQPDRSGHIAIVRPAQKSPAQLVAEGPDIIQAGGHNFQRTSVRRGFANHPGAFAAGEIFYYAHAR